MDLSEPIDRLLCEVAALDRAGCTDALRTMPHLKIDFTDEYYEQQSLEGLRHLVMAAVLQARRHLREAG